MIMPMQNKSEIGNSDGRYQHFAGNPREKTFHRKGREGRNGKNLATNEHE
jgi:hypothetical protein